MYRMHKVFCATAWELEGERRAFYDVIGQFNETEAMRHGMLYVPVSLTNVRDKRPYQYVVEENLRDCRHYILAVRDGWGPPERNFEQDYRLALDCCANPVLPMKEVLLLLCSLVGQPSLFAAELSAAGYAPTSFADVEAFQRLIRQRLSAWLAAERLDAASQSSDAP